MACYICGEEAVERCYTCGQLFCAKHGRRDCVHCQSGVIAEDLRADRVSGTPLIRRGRTAWWRPQVAEDYEPPACYQCKGIARRACRNCHNLYCPEHAGGHELCASCDRSSWLGLIILAAIGLFMALFIGFGHLVNLLR